MKKFKAVLIDYDGVVGETMKDNFLAWKSAFSTINVSLNQDDYFPLEGKTPLDVAETILAKYKLESSLKEKIAHLKHENYAAITQKKGVKVYAGIEKILGLFKQKGLLTALVTGAARDRVEKSIPLLINYFDYVVAADDTFEGGKIKGKPAPDPFLVATRKLAVNPKACLVIENAPLGIFAAKAAGCYCLALTTTVNKKKLSEAGADLIFQSHQDLLEYFQNNL